MDTKETLSGNLKKPLNVGIVAAQSSHQVKTTLSANNNLQGNQLATLTMSSSMHK